MSGGRRPCWEVCPVGGSAATCSVAVRALPGLRRASCSSHAPHGAPAHKGPDCLVHGRVTVNARVSPPTGT